MRGEKSESRVTSFSSIFSYVLKLARFWLLYKDFKMKTHTIFLSAFVLIACGSQVPLPDNVSTIQSGPSQYEYIDEIDTSKLSADSVDFSLVKLCVAETVTNEDVVVKDASGSWVGPYTGTYYQSDNRQILSGADVLKYIDDDSSSLIAVGTTSYIKGSLIPIRQFIRFSLKATSEENGYSLVFSNVTRAAENTGSASNDGFTQVGTWAGADPDGVINQLQQVADRIHSCLQG